MQVCLKAQNDPSIWKYYRVVWTTQLLQSSKPPLNDKVDAMHYLPSHYSAEIIVNIWDI